jgi:hypothetical protein
MSDGGCFGEAVSCAKLSKEMLRGCALAGWLAANPLKLP